MTDFNEDVQTDNDQNNSFKAKILADLEKANRLRQQREQEMLKQEEETRLLAKTQATAEAAKEAASRLKERDDVDRQLKQRFKEKAAQAQEHFEKLSETQKLQALKDSDLIDDLSETKQFTKADFTQETLIDKETTDSVKTDIEAIKALLDEAERVRKAKASLVEEEQTALDSTGLESNQEPKEQAVAVEPAVSESSQVEESNVSDSADPLPRQEAKSQLEEEKKGAMTRSRRKKTNSIAKRIAKWIISLLMLVILATGAYAYYYVDSSIKPLDSKDKTYIQVEIPEGSGNKLIGQTLEKAGVIKSGMVFNFYTKFKNYTNFQSGYYNLQKSMSLDDIAKELQKGGTAEPTRPVLGKILIKEGYTIAQIAEAVTLNANTASTKDKTPYSADDFLEIIKNDAFIAKMKEKYPTLLATLPAKESAIYQLEGYLFPATYDYYKETKLEDLVEQMIATMDSQLSSLYQEINNQNMTVNELLTMASLVEKEGATDDDRRTIAGVFYNRLNQGVPLQSNIAILYAMGKLGEKITLAEDAGIDTEIASPYNIYANTGLMPGPVDNPGLAAIKATLEAKDTSYMYFVADVKTGAVYFAETLEEHNRNVEQYVNSQLAG